MLPHTKFVNNLPHFPVEGGRGREQSWQIAEQKWPRGTLHGKLGALLLSVLNQTQFCWTINKQLRGVLLQLQSPSNLPKSAVVVARPRGNPSCRAASLHSSAVVTSFAIPPGQFCETPAFRYLPGEEMYP